MSKPDWQKQEQERIANIPIIEQAPSYYPMATAIDEIVSGRRVASEIVDTENLNPYSVHYYYDAANGRYAESDAHMSAFKALRGAYDACRGASMTPMVEQDMVLCSCGHHVSHALVMHASFGTSCPECYDRMSR
jgi:hypothetical protein